MQNLSSNESANLKSLASTLLVEGENLLHNPFASPFCITLLHHNDTLPLSDDLMRLLSFGGGGSSGGNEGFSRTVYFCPAGYPTIGYGHLVKDDEGFSAGIDEAQAEEPLRQDAQIAERAVLRLINVALTDGQFDALVSFTYNLGGGALQRSTLRRKINREEHTEVPEQLMRLKSGQAVVYLTGWFGDVKLRFVFI